MAIIGAVNSVIAFGYYGNVMREIWMRPVPDGDKTAIVVPSAVVLALTITVVATLVFGVLPSVGLNVADMAQLVGAFGG